MEDKRKAATKINEFQGKVQDVYFDLEEFSDKDTKPYHVMLPIPVKEIMNLQITCEQCNARYSVLGCAFFCPCCGHNSVERTFDDSLKK